LKNSSKILDKNIFQLEVLRGLAILLVMTFHFFRNNFPFGWVGVDLFFVLSGFLITGKLVESMNSPGFLRSFYIRRILRIVPLYFAVLAFFFLLLPFLNTDFYKHALQSLSKQQWYYWTFSVNFLEAKHGWPTNISLNHLWSIACEMQFYLIWPFVIRWVVNHRQARLAAFLFVVLFALVFRTLITDLLSLNYLANYVLPFSRIDAFAIGGFLYFYCTSSRPPNFRLLLLVGLASITIILFLVFWFELNWHYSNYPVQTVGYTLNAFFWGSVVGISCLSRFNNHFLYKCLAKAGKYSYGLYIFHVPVMVAVQKTIKESIGDDRVILVAAVSFFISILLAVLSYHSYERYFFRMRPAFAPIQKSRQVR